MTTPTTPLKLTFDPDELTLDELEIFESFHIGRFKKFMAAYSNWSAVDVGGLTRKELLAVADQIAEIFKDGALPKASAPSSEPGPG